MCIRDRDMVLPGGGKFLHARWAPRRVDAAEARVATAVARWLRPRSAAAGAAVLGGRPVAVRGVRVGAVAIDPDGAVAVIRGAPEPVSYTHLTLPTSDLV